MVAGVRLQSPGMSKNSLFSRNEPRTAEILTYHHQRESAKSKKLHALDQIATPLHP
jgi:hypothetical protein